MVAHNFPLRFTTINMFIIFFLTITSNVYTYGNEYKECSSLLSCGNFTHIGYPFWGAKRPQFCGHPKFKLVCPDSKNNNDPNHNHDYPVLQIDQNPLNPLSFLVLNISNSKSSYRAIRLQELYPDSVCASDLSRSDVLKSFINFSKNVDIIRLFHGCPAPLKADPNDSVMCLNKNYGSYLAYYQRNMSDSHNADYCPSLSIPVLKEEFKKLELRKERLKDVLKKGFEVVLNDKYTRKCFMCESSGGACGSSISSGYFVCYRKNHPSSDVNPKSGKKGNRSSTLTFAEKWKLKLILGLAIPGCIFILIAFKVALCCYIKKLKFRSPVLLSKTFSYYDDLERSNSYIGIPVFSYAELQEATNNFDSTRELGDGGFGVVYHGKLQDGREVAVKHLFDNNYNRKGQFMNEIQILTNLHHQNLVKLYGGTSRHSRELLLVYELAPNGTVADHLYGNQSGSRTLPWSIRMNIAIQTASALSYLHASDIIHRDVKTKNILLDSDFTVKVSDFGLSRLFPFDATHVSTAPQGTPGYLDPEYHKYYQLTDKSDVYSFGVVLIELISSLPAIDINRNKEEINLSNYAMNIIRKGELETLVDRQLGFETDFKVKKMTALVAELAFQCLQQEKDVRPSMEEVFEALKQIKGVDSEALESEEKGQSVDVTKPTSELVENDGDHHQKYPISPISVIQHSFCLKMQVVHNISIL